MTDKPCSQALVNWSTTFLRISMHNVSRSARSSGISLQQLNVLLHLYYNGEREIMDFTDMLQISPAGASQMVERMVKLDWVTRDVSPADHRVRLVNLTPVGREVIEHIIHKQEEWLNNLTEQLSEQECQEAQRILTHLTNLVTTPETKAL